MSLQVKTVPYDKENDALRASCSKLIQDKVKLQDMLSICVFSLVSAGAILPKHIQDWWDKYQPAEVHEGV